jgi:hypothetical protein
MAAILREFQGAEPPNLTISKKPTSHPDPLTQARGLLAIAKLFGKSHTSRVSMNSELCDE